MAVTLGLKFPRNQGLQVLIKLERLYEHVKLKQSKGITGLTEVMSDPWFLETLYQE